MLVIEGVVVEKVRVKELGETLVIELNRPEAKNALDIETAGQLAAALDRLEQSPTLRVGVLTGAGADFCAGMDLKGFARGEMPFVEGRGLGGLTEALPTKPLIAAVEGWALAGGFELMLSCDLAVAGRSARFGLPEVKRGLVAAAGGLMRLPDMLPQQVAMELILTGDPISAERLQHHGLLNAVVDDGSAADAALALASRICGNGPLAVKVSKEVVLASRGWSPEERFARQASVTDAIFASADAREGALAFAEKRAPRWVGR